MVDVVDVVVVEVVVVVVVVVVEVVVVLNNNILFNYQKNEYPETYSGCGGWGTDITCTVWSLEIDCQSEMY